MMGWGVPEQGWRKGPWTPEEDKLLHQYVNLHGDGKWSSVAKSTGLKRSGKSCRLRWVNYLRPGLKRGQITPQEEAIITELHSLWGNKWSTIARYLPGRTDNEIKNYWRTHFKKREKGGPSSQKERRKEYQMLKQKQKQREEEEEDDTNDHTVEASANSASASAINGKNVMIEGQGTRELENNNNNNTNNNNNNNNNMVFMYGSNYYSWEDQQCWPMMSNDQDVAEASWSESSMGEEGLWSGLWNLDDLSTAHYHHNNNSKLLPTQNTNQQPQYNSSYSGGGDAPINSKGLGFAC